MSAAEVYLCPLCDWVYVGTTICDDAMTGHFASHTPLVWAQEVIGNRAQRIAEQEQRERNAANSALLDVLQLLRACDQSDQVKSLVRSVSELVPTELQR